MKTGEIKHLPTFAMSQDPLEAHFGRIRARGGNNDNPTTQQFKSAFRKTLIHKEITASLHANCMDKLNIFYVKSTSKPVGNIEEMNEMLLENIEPFCDSDYLLDACNEATMCRIAGDIEHIIRSKGRFNCDQCLQVLNENIKVSTEIIRKERYPPPCVSTVYICKVASKYLNIYKNQFKFDHEYLMSIIHQEIKKNEMNIFSKTNFENHESHRDYFITCIAEEFIRIQATEYAKMRTLEEKRKMLRNKMKKMNHVNGE